jgi:hypothetical protein
MLLKEIKWGDDSAEKDPDLLDYFVTSDHFDRLKSKTKSILIGRKGSGKSALRKKLFQEFSTEENTFVVNVSPSFNSIRTILNDKDINQTFGEEIFFQHTWLRQIYLDCLCAIGHEAAGKYAEKSLAFARNIATELNRTSKDIVENIADVLSKIKVKAGNLGDLGLYVEKELRNIADLDALEHHVLQLANDGANFVVLVDDLDLGWDNSQTANNMLLGLLTACNTIAGKSHNIFPCVFLREDVYSLLITQTQHSDKFRNVERIRWDRDSLVEIVNTRIKYNRARHSLPRIDTVFETVFPETIGTSNTVNWILERTLNRPRELIQLVRYYTESVNADTPDAEALKECEATYSSWKLDDLCTEYSNQYPNLVALFSYWKTSFFRTKYHLSQREIEEMLLQAISEITINEHWWNTIVQDVNIKKLLEILYEVGFLGDFVKGGEGGSRTFYSFQDRHAPRFEEVQIHPCFRRSVNTVERIKRR